MKLTYKIHRSFKKCLALKGDIRSLSNPEISGVALPGVNSVRFARTHDTAFDPNRNRDLCQVPTEQPSNICFSDSGDPKNEKDTFLGIAYILSLAEGLPLIYIHDADNLTVLAGVKFHEMLLHQPQYFRNGNEISPKASNPNLLFIERGSKGLTIINKSGNSFDTRTAKMPGLEVGCYKELQYNFEMCVDSDKYINKWKNFERGGINIQARSALFFVKV